MRVIAPGSGPRWQRSACVSRQRREAAAAVLLQFRLWQGELVESIQLSYVRT